MRINQKGMTLAEVLVSLLLVTLVMFAAIAFMTTSYQSTRSNQEKEFATQKAMSILDELKSFVEDNASGGLILDDFDDPSPTPVLTIQTTALPGDPISANISYPYATGCTDCSGWLYERQITVAPLGEDDNRLVNVKIFIFKEKKKRLIAEVASVLRTIAPSYSPTQVYDVYLLAIDNIPGWWVYMSNIVPFVQSTLQDLQARNPGLEFRTHWIRRLSYGRDFQYRPYFNSAADTTTGPMPYAYFYPGLLPNVDAGNYASAPVSFYYLPGLVRARINVDGTDTNGYNAGTNPFPYALADNYNNAMRFPDEQAWFNSRVGAGDEDPDEPTYRLLLEDMFQNPANYHNSILINLHGELFPFPPVRNYSDPAKNPEDFTWAQGGPRAVTHAQQLKYSNSDNLVLRVYSYLSNYTKAVGDNTHLEYLTQPITVLLKNISWTPSLGEVVSIEGGALNQVSVDGFVDPYVKANALSSITGNRMYYTAAPSGSDTLITLNFSTLISLVDATGGLDPLWHLYGMNYIPSPLEDVTDIASPAPFTRDLADDTLSAPKNTARWILTIPSASLPSNGMITVETRIGTSLTTGVMYPSPNEPANLSKTYVWRGTDTWLYGDGTFTAPPNLPLTERFQTIGDPRHLPYADLKQVYVQTTRPLGSGFNRYFDDFGTSAANNRGDRDTLDEWVGWQSTAGIPNGIKNLPTDTDYNNDGWDVTEAADPGPQGMLEVDVNRIFQMYRTVLLKTHSVYTTLSGFSYAYLGLGGEIGYDAANGFPLGIPISSLPFTGASGSIHHENSIFSTPDDPTNDTFHFKYIRRFDNNWFAKYWVGELYPDDVYATQWSLATGNGNLTAGNTAMTTFIRVPRGTIVDGTTDQLPRGTELVSAGRSPEEEGSTAFFNIGTSDSTFHHQCSVGGLGATDLASSGATDQGDLQTDGTEVAGRYNLTLPTTTAISRPFQIAANLEGRAPDHFNSVFYDTGYVDGTGNVKDGVKPTVPSSLPSATFYDHELGGAYLGSALVTLRETLSGTDTGALYAVVNGIDKTGESGTVFIGKWSILSLVHSFLKGGLGSSPTRIRELPRIFVSPFGDTELNNPSTLAVDWIMSWKRWDSQDYTDDAAYDTFVEDTNTSHVVIYSEDNGATWFYAADDTAAIPGQRPTAVGVWAQTAVVPGTTNFTYNWAGISGLLEGSVLLRVEAYRDAFPLHYSYHQRRIFIKR